MKDIILCAIRRSTGEVLAGGKVVGKVVPLEATDDMMRICQYPRPLDINYRRMLSAARVDLSAAEVKVPELMSDALHVNYRQGHNAAIQSILDQIKERA